MIEGIIKTNMKKIKSDSGLLFHGLKKSDIGFKEFGEVYFSTINKNSIRAWKLHQKMTLNLIVPEGEVLFIFKDNRVESSTYNEVFKIILSQNPYQRLTVPPGIWFGFQGLSSKINLICNIADIAHDPKEVIRKEIDDFKIDWEIK